MLIYAYYVSTAYSCLLRVHCITIGSAGVTWYQGEANVGGAAYYSQAFPAMITGWRTAFAKPDLWFGFVQIAGWGYSRPYGAQQCEQDHSWSVGDLRQAPPPTASESCRSTRSLVTSPRLSEARPPLQWLLAAAAHGHWSPA